MKFHQFAGVGGVVSALAIAAGGVQAAEFRAGDTTISVGGYLKLDAIYNVDEDLGDTAFFRGLTVPDDNIVDGKTRFHAKQSRLNITTSTPMAGSELFTRLETDFFSGANSEVVSNSNTFRIRHAYASWNGVLAGQTWSNFMPMVFAPTLDFGGPAGYIFNRQAQVRYTTPEGFSISVENPETNVVNNADGRADNDPWPDLTARFAGSTGNASYSISGVVNRLEVDDGSNSDSTTGFAVNAAGSYQMGSTTVGGQIGFYDGANRYLWQTGIGGGGFNNGYVDDNGNIETIEEFGLMLYLDQGLTPRTNFGLALGWIETDSDEETAALANTLDETLYTVHANIRHRPAPHIMYGAEVQYGQREFFNGDDADGVRLQFSAQYNF